MANLGYIVGQSKESSSLNANDGEVGYSWQSLWVGTVQNRRGVSVH